MRVLFLVALKVAIKSKLTLVSGLAADWMASVSAAGCPSTTTPSGARYGTPRSSQVATCCTDPESSRTPSCLLGP